MAYADETDVQTELGRPPRDDAEKDQWLAWLARVERAIERAFRRAGYNLATQVALGNPTEQDVIDAEVAAVIRRIQNPNYQQTSVTRSLDDGSVTYRNESGRDGDPLDLTDAELGNLLPSGRKRARAYSVMPS